MEMLNPYALTGKTLLVTGASSGIGKAIAIACARLGASVIITGRDSVKLNETLASLHQEGKHISITADLTNFDELTNLVVKLPKLDGVVHCAGVGKRTFCKDISNDTLDYIMGINFNAPVILQSVLMQNKKLNRSASIVFIASAAANMPTIGNAIYSASKGAIISYAKCLALELAPRKIRVNCICPAMVWTDLIIQEGVTKEEMEQAQYNYPLKRYGQPSDIANLSTYLLSDASLWMTGSCIPITGGAQIL